MVHSFTKKERITSGENVRIYFGFLPLVVLRKNL